MDFEAVKAWLTQRAQKLNGNRRLMGILGLVLVPVALIVATICVYWLLRLFTHDASYNLGDPTLCLLISLAIIPCLFIGNRLVPRRDLMEEQLSEGSDRSIRRQSYAPVFPLDPVHWPAAVGLGHAFILRSAALEANGRSQLCGGVMGLDVAVRQGFV
jgi:hypothetical protein